MKKIICFLFLTSILGNLSAAEYSLIKTPENGWTKRDGLPNFSRKLFDGKDVTVAYIGGSITAQDGWRVKTTAWLREKFPDVTITEVNATIGGTGSDLGVFRFDRDVLAYSPDLIFVEFAVNDGGADPARIVRAMEGMVRKAWAVNAETDICFTYTYANGFEHSYREGNLPRSTSADETLAAYYGIPTLDMAGRVVRYETEKKLVFAAPKGEYPEGKITFSEDGVHPIDAGHEVYMEVVKPALGEMLKEGHAARIPHEMKTPLEEDHWADAKIVPVRAEMLGGEWELLPVTEGLGQQFAHRMDEIWHSGTPGATLTIRFRGSMVGIYDLLGPDGGQIFYEVNGVRKGPQPFFDRYCTGHRLATFFFAADLERDAEHTVMMELDAEQPDRASVTDREKEKPWFDAKRYDGMNVWVGGIMLRGEL